MEYKETGEEITKVVGAVIVNKKRDTILVGQRAATAKHPLKWEFIGGKINPGEDLESAARRELSEETGLDVEVGRVLDTSLHDYGGEIGVVQVNFVECYLKNGVIRRENFEKDYKDIRWVSLAEIPNLDWIDADREFAHGLATYLTPKKPSKN